MDVITLKIHSSWGLAVFRMKRVLRGGLSARSVSLHCDVSAARAHGKIQMMALARELFQGTRCHLAERTREIMRARVASKSWTQPGRASPSPIRSGREGCRSTAARRPGGASTLSHSVKRPRLSKEYCSSGKGKGALLLHFLQSLAVPNQRPMYTVLSVHPMMLGAP